MIKSKNIRPAGPGRHFPEETQELKPNRLFEAKPGNISKLLWQLSNEKYLFISALAWAPRKYGKRVGNRRFVADGVGQNPVLLRV